MAFNIVGWGKGFDPTMYMMNQWFPGLDPAPPGDNSPVPQPPGFTPVYSQDQLNSIPVDLSGINAYRQEATRKGPSGWANLAKTANAAQESNQNEQAQKTAGGQTAAAENSIASSGGLSSGARERAAESGATNYLDMSQNLQRQGNLNDLQVGINDEQNRIQQLGALPGMETQAIQPLFQKASMVGQNNQAANSYNQNLYNQQMQTYASGQTANAIQNSGGNGPSFICTALREKGLLRPREARKIFEFGIKSFVPRADFVFWYFTTGQKAVEQALVDNAFNWEKLKPLFIDEVFALMDKGEDEKAQDTYIRYALVFAKSLGYKSPDHLAHKSRLRANLYLPLCFLLPGAYRWVFESLKRSKVKRILANGIG